MKRSKIEELFKQLDKNRKGYLEEKDFYAIIPKEFKRLNKELSIKFQKSDRLSQEEFIEYIIQKDSKMRKNFTHLTNESAEFTEFKTRLSKEHIHLRKKYLDCLLNHIDRKNDNSIDYHEWRDYLIFVPDLYEIIDSDFNSNYVEDDGGRFKFLLAGGIAGAVSRTCTAPLDRLKVLISSLLNTEFSNLANILGLAANRN